MVNGIKLSTTVAMQSLRRCHHHYHRQRTSWSRLISSSSQTSKGARATAATTTSWELNEGAIVASRRAVIENPAIRKPRVVIKPWVREPTFDELKTLFATSALPMVGFGFMDNFIMIQAGGYIDSTLGIQFGLATLTAAAMGQVVSDVSGVLFGSTVDTAITRLGLVKPSNMTPSQRRLPKSVRVSLAGAVVGVIVGCCLGATSLYFVPDLHHCEKMRDLNKVKEIVLNMLSASGMECDNCSVYLAESPQLPSGRIDQLCEAESETSSTSDQIQMNIHLRAMHSCDQSSIHQQCARDGVTITSNRNGNGQTICTPIYGKNNSILGVLEFALKQPYNSHNSAFGEREEQLAQVTARHIGIILEHCL